MIAPSNADLIAVIPLEHRRPGSAMSARGRYEIAIVGGGVVGAATAFALANRGVATVLLEAADAGHACGSSKGTARIWHLAGYPTEEYFERGIRSLARWRELERESGATLLVDVDGGLSTGAGVEQQAALLRAAERDAQLLSASDVARRFPGLALPMNAPALYQRDSAVILANVALGALYASAERAGAQVIHRAVVNRLEVTRHGPKLHTTVGLIHASRVIVTAGPWTKRLLATVGIEIDVAVYEQTIAWFHLPSAPLPVLIDYDEPGPYWLPDPGHGLKAALHTPGRSISDPDDPPGTGDQNDVREVARWVAARLPGARPEVISVETCRYTWAGDERFKTEKHGAIIVGSACSGRGFHLAPHTAELLADLAVQ
jgi:glycine/D-amino acid oxidase-like deaminating enzyme